jgi:Lon protease-like protein
MGIEARFDAFEAAADEALVTTLAMVCPFSPGEKQALLEAAFFPDRASMLVGLMEMALGEAGHQAGDARH